MSKLLFSVSIHDCKVQTFTVGGHGGAGKDTSNTGVRVVHEPSGASGEARETRSQLTNKRTAFRRMAQSKAFQTWVRLKASALNDGLTVDQKVEELMEPANIKVEYKTKEGWKEESICGKE